MLPRIAKIFFAATIFCATADAAKVVATVGNKKITLKEFNDRYRDVLEQTVNPPTKELFLEDLVRYEVGLQEARKKKLQNDPHVRERMNQELYKALIEQALADKVEKIKVTESDMKKFYKDNPEIRTSHILTEYRPDATPKQIRAARKRAEEIYEEVKKSKRPFGELAELYSDDTITKRNKGDVGWQNRLTLTHNYYQAALRMKKGQVRGLIRTQFGFHIIKLTGRRSYAEANKRSIRMAVFDQKRKALFDNFFAQVKRKYRISINKKLLK